MLYSGYSPATSEGMWEVSMQAKNKMREFASFHPSVNFIYFFAVIGFSMFFMNPVCLLISFVCATVYSVMLSGRRAAFFNLFFLFVGCYSNFCAD